MSPTASPLSFLIIALTFGSVAASPTVARAPPASLAFRTKFNVTGAMNIVQADQARAKVLRENALAQRSDKRAVVSFPVTNTVVTYTANVGVGSPATDYTLLIDTGSSNTWIGASKSYVKTPTSKSTGQSVSVSYGSGSFYGTEYLDTVTLAPGLVIPSQSIGVASTSSGFSGVDGILGIGPVDLTEGTVGNSQSSVPTVTDNLFSHGTISANEIGIYYTPTTSDSNTNGELTFGGVDTTKTTSSVSYVPLTSTSPARYYWGINQSLSYGSSTILSTTAGIVDTGTTLVLIASDAFSKYQTATGGTPDSATGLLRITPAQYNVLQNLNFNIGGRTYPLTPNAQIFPRSLNTLIGGSSGAIYLIVADIGSNSGTGLDFINGYTFLERYYSVFDTANHRVGFATTAHTTSTSN